MATYPTFENISEEQYLAREPEAEYKSEFRNGRVVAMSGASPAHSLLTSALALEIGRQLVGRPCRFYSNDLRTKVAAARLYTYPDGVVVCGESRFDSRDKYALVNPTVIFEVLSPSTEAYDRGEKFGYYQKIDSLRHYILVSQNKIAVAHFFLHEGRWVEEALHSPQDILALPSIPCRVRIGDLYDKVDFASDSET